MLRQQPFKQKQFVYSLVLHVILLFILIVSVDSNPPMPVVDNTNKNDVINAMVINSSPDTPKKRIPLPVPAAAQPKPAPEPPKPVVTKPAPEPPKPVITKSEKTPPAQQAVVIPDPKKHQEETIRKQLLADLKKQTNTPKVVQRQTSIEADFAKEMKAVQAKSLEQQMAQEKQRLHGLQSLQMRGVVDKYKALILQSISQHWLVPHHVDSNVSAQLLIRLAPGGMVLDVQVIKSSGDDALDRSARAAVYKASPLPVPEALNEFEAFRQLVLKVKPENVI